MKRLISAIALLILISQTTSAQFDRQHNVGVRAGIGISNLAGFKTPQTGSIDMNTKLAFQLGVADAIRILPRGPLFLETGLYYTHYGSSYNILINGSGNTKNVFRMGYLKLPVMANIHINILRDATLQFYAGPYYSFGIYGTGKVKDKDEDGKRNKQKYDLFKDNIDEGTKQIFTHSDFGLRFGVAATYERYYFGLGYDFGLLNIAKINDCKARTANGFLMVGLNF